jgi:hypothetical protein
VKAAQGHDGIGDAGRRTQRQKRDARCFGDDGLENGDGIHRAGRNTELRMTAKGAAEQLCLHTVRVRNEDVDSA